MMSKGEVEGEAEASHLMKDAVYQCQAVSFLGFSYGTEMNFGWFSCAL
jgi:hypothetical protein